jgi:hypothetical protein
VLTDRFDHLAVPTLFPLHVHRNQRMRRRDQKQDVKNQPENHAKDDQDQFRMAEKGCPFSNKPTGGNKAART